MTSTNPLDLDAIEARTNAAEDGWHVVFDNDTYRHEIHGDGPTHVAVFGGNPDDAFASYPVEANAEFAAHARTDVPLLLAEVRRLRAELAHTERIRENADFHLGQEMARRQLAEKETARLRTEAASSRADVLAEVANELEGIDFHPNAKATCTDLCRQLAGRFRRKGLAAIDDAAPAVVPAR